MLKYILGIYALLAVIGIVVAWYFLVYKRKQNSSTSLQSNKNKRKKLMEHLQTLYKRFPLTKSIYSKTFNRLSNLYPAEVTTIHRLTTETLNKTMFISLLIMAVGVLTANGSIIYIVAFGFIAYLSISLYIDTDLEAKERRLLRGFFQILPKIGKEYEKTKILEVAIYNVYLGITSENTFGQKKGLAGKLFKKRGLKQSNNAIVGYHLQRIHKVLTSPPSKFDLEVQMYLTSAPNQFLTMFLSICKNIKVNGDKGLRTGEGSVFKKRLYELQELVSDEINNTEKLYEGMKATPFVALGCLLLIQPFRLFSEFALPDIESFFKTSFWNVLVVSVFATTYFIHKYIMKIKNPFSDKQVTETLSYRILQGEPILTPPRFMGELRTRYLEKKARTKQNNFINRKLTEYQQKYYSRCMRIDRKLKRGGENISVKMFLLKKCIFALVGFIATILLCVSGVLKDKYLAVPSYTQSFEEALAPSDAYKSLMSDVATDIERMTGTKVENQKTITQMVIEDGRVTREDMAEVIAEEIVAQNKVYNSKYFKWYYLFIALAVGVVAFYIPDIFLKKQGDMAEIVKEDEINQFRAIISLDMENSQTTARTILYDMQKFARYYKEPISKCIINMDVNQRKALTELKKADNSDSPFADIVDGLINISVSGVQKAFESIKAEKEFYRENRKLQIDRINTAKINKAQKLCLVPAYVTIVMTLFLPLGLKAFEMFNSIGLK